MYTIFREKYHDGWLLKNSLPKPMETACLNKDKTNKGCFLFVSLFVCLRALPWLPHDKAWQDA